MLMTMDTFSSFSLCPSHPAVVVAVCQVGDFMFCWIGLGFSLYVMLVIESRHQKHLTRCPFSLNFPYNINAKGSTFSTQGLKGSSSKWQRTVVILNLLVSYAHEP